MGISHFRISGQSFIKENWHKSRTSDDFGMKLGPVTKLDKSKTTSKNWGWLHVNKLWHHCYFFPIYSQFGAIRKPNSGRIVCKSYIFINSNFLSYKKSNAALTVLLWVKRLFLPKNAEFLQKNADISKI